MFLASAVVGFAVAAKWTVAPVMLTVVLAWVYVHLDDKAVDRRISGWVVGLLAIGGCFAAGFLIGGFELLLNPAHYIEYMLFELQSGAQGGFWIWEVDSVSGWAFYLETLSYGLGVTVLALALVGLVRRLSMVARTRDRGSILLVSFVLPYYALMGATRHYFARYALPLVPFCVLFAADGVQAISARVGRKRPEWRWALIGVLSAVAIAQPLAWSIRHDTLLTRMDTRTLAKEWIETNIPAGAKFGALLSNDAATG